MNLTKVYLTGGDHLNLALDDDLRVTKNALTGVVDVTSGIAEAGIVHSVSWEELLQIPTELLLGKRIICHVSGEPFRYLKDTRFSRAMQYVGLWIAQSRQAQEQLSELGLSARLIPYAADARIFRPLPADDAQVQAVRAQWQIPAGAYLIGNFHRDTEGHDLNSPKLVKGPDLFAEIMHLTHQHNPNLHVVLGGPRRHWLRQQLTSLGVPYTYVGRVIDNHDDLEENTLPQSTLNLLYNLIDLYIVSSRSEGGPRSILEAMLAQCKIISTPVGLAPDLLDATCIYRNVVEGAQLVGEDMAHHRLDPSVEPHFRRAVEHYRPEALTPHFAQLYHDVASVPVFHGEQAGRQPEPVARDLVHRRLSWKSRLKQQLRDMPLARRLWRRYGRRLMRRSHDASPNRTVKPATPRLTVCLWHKFVPPPYGGGNQFMLALKAALIARNVHVVENEIDPQIDAYVLNSVQFDIDGFMALRAEKPLAIVHRIDGPISLIRGCDLDQDELCFEINEKFAAVTVLQSNWTLLRSLELGFRPVNPVVIYNAANPTLFHAQGRAPYDPKRKVRLISTSWSDNPRKGGALYRWLDQNLDWDRFEYTFVGRVAEEFEHINLIKPVGSAELGEILRQHDIYITASQNDPCSNALIEALTCGLPALYLNDGGHPELTSFGGLPFTGTGDVLEQLDLLTANYEVFQRLIAIPTLGEIGDAYFAAIERAVTHTRSVRALVR